jgi:predicted dehydrogenase
MIGVGGRGSGVLEAIHKSAGVRVVALCDIKPERLAAGAGIVEGDDPELFSDYRRMLEKAELDAVFVATPCHLHHEMMMAVLLSGRHCYGEKPMALAVPHLNEIVKTVKATNRIFQIGTQLPYTDPCKASLAAIREGAIGKPLLIRAHRHNPSDVPRDHLWFFKRAQSGDMICEQAVHEFDVFNRVFQGIPERAAGFGGQSLRHEPEGRDIMDNYGLVLDYGKNQRVSYSHSFIASPAIPSDGRRELVYGETGAIDIETGILYPREGKPRKVADTSRRFDSTQAAVDDFFRCIREGTRPMCDAEAGRDGALVALLGRKAIDEGRVVSMNELLTGTTS